MVLMIISLILWVLILAYNVVYSFLPTHVQGLKWVRAVAIIAAIIILVSGIAQEIKKYCNLRFAYISSNDGAILKRKNFPWNITKTKTREGDVVYIINERYGDASDVTIKPEKLVKYYIYNAVDGVGIKFSGPGVVIPNFTIKISD